MFRKKRDFLLIVLFFVACKVIDPDEPIPSYLEIDRIKLQTNYTEEGSSSHKITDAWVYIDDNFLGVFELPAIFPVLYSSNSTVRIKAGIKSNGISATRIIYPFFISFVNVMELNVDNVHVVNPTVNYTEWLNMLWHEDFEEQGVTIESGTLSDTSLVILTGQNVFEGDKSGAIYLDTEHPYYEGVTADTYILPKTGQAVFLELNYKTTSKLEIGIYANSSTQVNRITCVGINPSVEWNKIYVNLTDNIAAELNAVDFRIFLETILEPTQSESSVLIDNIKLVY